ncbi:UbiH/UbiF/VisC/COQ6 family ubiquinone biosynthesis hydroxylase [Phenylobacterium sp.]|uniref:UbiH/UbiF/VisC/COQ6 family ubiquinone biosynthesis hydroxylase n=1 Tax=Phenylobacterium sp. TaxID=1871053 RepID=UPI0025E1A7A4|nr:UbiH/UbiF/VisC/COQ6 family ubiquinone biosynthesis hydroxylase [Phenylobacterium sp.]MBX3485312.1 UbiH/UbiF/VisC/COQ6 family ubiquinone biosynthesis hydroxylase [Phenylobacterium sp.]MCW5759470.1 UbiH/UbiF/VisC/COQ6 family ubiquinone biosynthesis hydroxylase [Phenylobacterium sp.]
MSEGRNADVIVAGAGMAGATLALSLKQAGLDPVLIDPVVFDDQVAPAFDGRASAIAYAAYRQWRALGLADALDPHAQRIEQILVTDSTTPGAAAGAAPPFFLRFDSAEIADRSDGEPLGYLLENRHIRAALAGAVKAAGIEVLAPARVAKAAFGPRAAEVTLADGRVLTAPLAVGAEGRGSVIRAEAGIGAIGWDYPQTGVVATVRLERPHGGVAHEYFLPGGPFAILPLTDDRASLVWTESTARGAALKAARPQMFQAHLERRFGDFLGAIAVEGPVFAYPLSLQLAERLVAPRVALLGDAAHGVHPIAGQGLNLGLKGAAALAEVLVDAARVGEDIGSEAVLERYAAWRRFDTVMLSAGMDAFVRLFSNDHPLLRMARGAGMAMVNRIGPARRFFMHEAGGAVGDLPRLLRGEAL